MWCSHVSHANDTTSSVLLLHTHTQRPLNHVSDVVWERPAHRHTRLALGRSRSRHAQQCMWSLPVMWSRASTAVSMLQWLTLRLDTCSSRTNSSPPPEAVQASASPRSSLCSFFSLCGWEKDKDITVGDRKKKNEKAKSLWRNWIAMKSEKRTNTRVGTRRERIRKNKENKNKLILGGPKLWKRTIEEERML